MARAALGRGQALQPSSVAAHSREPAYQAGEVDGGAGQVHEVVDE
jgi:hypothetical protein